MDDQSVLADSSNLPKPTVMTTQPEVATTQAPNQPQAMTAASVEQAIEAAVKGLRDNRDKILAEKKELQAELEAVKALYLGVDPKAIRQLQLDNEHLAKELEAMSQKNMCIEADMKAAYFRTKLQQVAFKAGLKAQAMPDVVERAKLHQWEESANGQYQAVDAKSSTPILSSSGQPLSLKVWLQELTIEAPHLFNTSSGGGAITHQSGASVVMPRKINSHNLQDIASGKVSF